MIHKIERLISVGKFRNYTAAGDVCFQKLTMIYANNGIGKTTLTAVIRSLATLQPQLVLKRISTNAVVPIAAQIIQRVPPNTDISHNLATTGWSNPFPDIEIFDIHFVNENIYSGFEFGKVHKEELYKFVLGRYAVILQQNIDTNKAAKTDSRERQQKYIHQLIREVGNGLTEETIPAFLNITPFEALNIATKITEAENTLQVAQQRRFIRTLPPLTAPNPINLGINYADLITDLSATSLTIQNIALQTLFEEHRHDLETNGISRAEEWLSIGYRYFSEKEKQINTAGTGTLVCPFCKQPVNSSLDIIEAFSSHFNVAFHSILERLMSYRRVLQNVHVNFIIQTLRGFETSNNQRIEDWTARLPITAPIPIFDIISSEEALAAELLALTNLVEAKIQNPSIAVDTTAVITFRDTIASMNSRINTYQQNLIRYNTALATIIQNSPDMAQAQTNLDRLRRIERRFGPEIDAICSRLREERREENRLSEEYTRLIREAADEANNFLRSYQERINQYLSNVFHTPFRIANVTQFAPHGQNTLSRTEYKLTIDGLDIAADPGQPRSAKDVLSEGDKSTIALAFFLAKLDIDGNKADKVLVFDDPLSSFDSKRRQKTIIILSALLREVKQLIVLSHDRKFLFNMNRMCRRRETPKKGLEIVFDVADNTSRIQFLDIEKMLQAEYFFSINKIKEFIDNGEEAGKTECRSYIRLVLEDNLIFKFYSKFDRAIHDTLPQLIERIERLIAEGAITFRDSDNAKVIADLRELDAISWDSHHGDGDVLEARDEVNLAGIDLEEFKDYLRTTLDLIENRI